MTLHLQVSLMITNPPLGRRVKVHNLHALFQDLFRLAASALRPGGRCVFINPLRLRPPAGGEVDAALMLEGHVTVDIGLRRDCSVEVWRRRPSAPKRSARSRPPAMGLFDSIKQAFDGIDDPKSCYALHILLKTRADALQLKQEIDEGEISFGDAARRYSSCPSAGKGGSLGQFAPGEMTAAFDALVFDPETVVGDVNVCSTQFGTHLVKVLERTGVAPAAPAEVATKAKAKAAEAAAQAAEAAAADPLRAAAEAAAAEAAEVEAEAGAEAEAEAELLEAPAGEMMEVVCPAELGPDRAIRIALPDAREFDVVVPADVAAGDAFLVGPFPVPE